MSRTPGKLRLWPLLLVGAAVAVSMALTWVGATDSSEQIRQEKVMATILTCVLASMLVLVWAGLFSGLPKWARIRLFLVLVGMGVAFAAVFRYRGVDGDLVPQFELRFRSSATAPATEAGTELPGASDFSQFLGSARDARVSGISLARDWESTPPRLVWRRPVGYGWSGFAVVGSAAVTHEQHSEEERVIRYELSTGRVVWASREVAHYENPLAGRGPRATPTLANGRVYAMGGTGLLTVLDLASGELLWKRDVLAESGRGVPVWGKSDSPLLVDELVVVAGGDSLLAYRAESGELAWSAGSDRPGYGSPFVTRIDGVRQIVSFNSASLSGHEPMEGRVLWRVDWPRQQPNVAQPLLLPGNRVLASSGYGVGAKLFEVRRLTGSSDMSVELVWESLRLKAKFANFVFHEGFVYGLDDGILVCLDPENGRRRWKGGRYGHGQLLLVRDAVGGGALLLVQGEQGEVFLVEPSPDGLRELTHFRAMDEKIWNSPALAGRYLLIRNDAEAALFELPVVASTS